MAVACCSPKMENEKVFKFHLTNFSYFEINVSLFKAPPCDKHRTLKSKQKSAVGTNVIIFSSH